MKIVKLTTAEVKSAICQTYSKKKENGKVYRTYSIKHGTSGTDFGYWLLPVTSSIDIPTSDGDSKELNDNKYILVKRKQDNKSVDRLGNNLYMLAMDYNTLHQKDLIVLWEIPNKNYTSVIYTINGDVEYLGKGYNGKVRGSIIYKSPAPVLEVFGDCTIGWEAVNKEGHTCTQQIAYDYARGQWDIQPIVTSE